MRESIKNVALLAGLLICANALRAQAPARAPQAPIKIMIGAGKTHLIDAPSDIERVSIASPEVAEAVAINLRTVMINGKEPGETSAILWLTNGMRLQYDIDVMFAASRMEAAKAQIAQEFKGNVEIGGDSNAVYLTGTVDNMFESQRAEAIGSALGKVVNLLKVKMPPQEQQILLRVKFADVDRSKASNYGVNFIGAPQGFPFTVTPGSNSPSRFSSVGSNGSTFNLSDALNILMFDPHLNAGATIQALQNMSILQILAEPNLLAMNGHEASFVAGGEFPFPTLNGGGSGVGQVTIQFREFGIKLRFTPTLTPRGTIRLHIAPEVSSLDYANSLTASGFTIPALTTRKVETEVELDNGQSFAIAGLLDQTTTEAMAKIPGLASLPILGKFFQSKNLSRSNSELMIVVTPELVSPLDADKKIEDLQRPESFLEGPGIMKTPPRTPGTDVTGPLPPRSERTVLPIQEMKQFNESEAARGSSAVSSAGDLVSPMSPTGSNPAAANPAAALGAAAAAAGVGK